MEAGVIESQVLGRRFIGYTDYDPKEKEQNDYITVAANVQHHEVHYSTSTSNVGFDFY